MDENHISEFPLGFPELTELGKRIEWLRIHRGISKQHLARSAGTSRQQLWRVMTGKSEMSVALRARLSDALRVSSLHGDESSSVNSTRTTSSAVLPAHPSPGAARVRESVGATFTVGGRSQNGAPRTSAESFSAYLADTSHITRTLATMPGGPHGRLLKRRLLDAIEDVAIDAGLELDPVVFELRRMVLSGQL